MVFPLFRYFLASVLCGSHALAYLPEEDMTVPEIIEYYGYPVEIIETTSEDGYILTMHRIPFDDTNAVIGKKRPVVFLQHGLLGSSADWVTNLPNQSAGFIFADAGFDVWMGNVRGNYYSQRHVNLSTSDRAYWQFTWDEMANYDLPAMVETALSISEQPFVHYVGHSQGTEIMFAKLASDPKFNAKVRKFFALAPVAAVGHIRGFFAWLADHFGSDLRILTKIFGTHEFLPHTWITKLFSVILCGPKFMNPLCDNVLFQIGGPESNQFNQTRLVVYLSHTPAGTSSCNVVHWAQMAVKKKIQKFDYGTPEENRQHYGQDTPPIYNLSNVNAPVYLYYSDADWLADVADIQESLTKAIPKEYVKLSTSLNDFNHFDFIWGLRAADEIYRGIIVTIQEDHMRLNNRSPKWKMSGARKPRDII